VLKQLHKESWTELAKRKQKARLWQTARDSCGTTGSGCHTAKLVCRKVEEVSAPWADECPILATGPAPVRLPQS